MKRRDKDEYLCYCEAFWKWKSRVQSQKIWHEYLCYLGDYVKFELNKDKDGQDEAE